MSLRKVFFRSFLLQGFWNYNKFQNIGVLYTLQPYLRKLYKDDFLYKRAKIRYLETFNSHPVFSTYSLGAMLQQEEKIAKLTTKEDILAEEHEWRIIRTSTANTAASIGDRLLWATLKPLSLVMCFVVLFALEVHILEALPEGNNIYYKAALAIFASLVIYNLPALFIRFKGLKDSYKGSEDDFYGLINLNWNKTISFFKTLGQILTLFVLFYGLYISFRYSVIDADSVTKASLLIAFIILSIFMKKLNMPNMFLYIIATLVFGLAAFIA